MHNMVGVELTAQQTHDLIVAIENEMQASRVPSRLTRLAEIRGLLQDSGTHLVILDNPNLHIDLRNNVEYLQTAGDTRD